MAASLHPSKAPEPLVAVGSLWQVRNGPGGGHKETECEVARGSKAENCSVGLLTLNCPHSP